MLNTGDLFRSSDLAVMSRARCLCATPVGFCCVKTIYNGRRLEGATFPSTLPGDNYFVQFAFLN